MNNAILLLHNFFYQAANVEFDKVLSVDPNCGIAYWGKAMTIWHPLWKIPSPTEMTDGISLLNMARNVSMDQRESDYVSSLEVIFKPGNHRQKVMTYMESMKSLSIKWGIIDMESTIFYCLSLITVAEFSQNSKQYLLRSGKTLDLLILDNPEHPGILHYLVHAYDTSELAKMGLDAARKYEKIVDKAPHQLHMPSHIYQFLGLWQESINTNVESVDSTKDIDQILHSMKYIIYALLQKGQIQLAKKRIDDFMFKYDGRMARTDSNFTLTAEIVFSSMPYFMETSNFEEMLSFTFLPKELNWFEQEWAWIVLYSNKMMAAAKLKKVELLDDIYSKLMTANKSVFENPKYDHFMVSKMNLYKSHVTSGIAWMKWSKGDIDGGLEILKNNALVFDPSLYPSFEMYGEMLLRSGKYQEAIIAFENSLLHIPNRFNTLYFAGLAAEKQNLMHDRDRYFLQLFSLCKNGVKICPTCTDIYNCERPEYAEVRGKLERNDFGNLFFSILILSFAIVGCSVSFVVFAMLLHSIMKSRKMSYQIVQ